MWYEGKLSNLKNGLERQNIIKILTDGDKFFVWIDENLMLHNFENQIGGVFFSEPNDDGSRLLFLRWCSEVFSLGMIEPCQAGTSRNVFADFDPDNTDIPFLMLCRDGVKRVVYKIDGELYMQGGQDKEALNFKNNTDIVRMARVRWVDKGMRGFFLV